MWMTQTGSFVAKSAAAKSMATAALAVTLLALGCTEPEAGREVDEPEVADPVAIAEAAFSITIEGATNVRPLKVSFENESSDAESYAWDFGDGGTSTHESPTHVYTEAGTYTVTLTAIGSEGEIDEAAMELTVDPIPLERCDFQASPRLDTEPLTVSLTNGSKGASSYAWSFGDGSTSTSETPSHTFAETGTLSEYEVTLTCTGEAGDTLAADPIKVTSAPRTAAGFSTDSTGGFADLEVQFSDTSREAVAWAWDFGDGTTSTDPSPRHTYVARPGENISIYTARLTTTGRGGDKDTVQTVVTVLRPTEPKITIVSGETRDYAVFEVEFSCEESVAYSTCSWDFGDGKTVIGETARYSFDHREKGDGLFDVELTTYGVNGDEASVEERITAADSSLRNLGFQADPVTGIGPLEVEFSGSVEGNLDRFTLDYGNDQNEYSASLADGEFDKAIPDQASQIRVTEPGVYQEIGAYQAVLKTYGYLDSFLKGGDRLGETIEIFVYIADPSFEEQAHMEELYGAWVPYGSDQADEQIALSAAEGYGDLGQMPTHPVPTSDSQYALLNGKGTVNTCEEGEKDGDVVRNGTRTEFYYPKGKPVIELDYVFISTEPIERGFETYTDEMVIEIDQLHEDTGDPVKTLFVAGADVSTPYLNWSEIVDKGRATPVQVASANLAEKFPGSDEKTKFRLRVGVRNCGEDDSDHAPYAEIDNVRFSASRKKGEPLVADFRISDDYAFLPGEKVLFENLSTGTGEGTSYFWDFGIVDETAGGETTFRRTYCDDGFGGEIEQGSGSAEFEPEQCFPEPGEYSVTLRVRRGDMLEAVRTKTIEIGTPPYIDFEYSPRYGAAPLRVGFESLSRGESRGPILAVTYKLTCARDAAGVLYTDGCVDPGDFRIDSGAPSFGFDYTFDRGKYDVAIVLDLEDGPDFESEPSTAEFMIMAQQGFDEVFAGFTNCVTGGCHNNATAAGGIVLERERQAYEALLYEDLIGGLFPRLSGDDACVDDKLTPFPIVNWYDPETGWDPKGTLFPFGEKETSTLYDKIDPDAQMPCGEDMIPHDMPFRGELQKVFDWIDDGAAR